MDICDHKSETRRVKRDNTYLTWFQFVVNNRIKNDFLYSDKINQRLIRYNQQVLLYRTRVALSFGNFVPDYYNHRLIRPPSNNSI